MISYNIINLHVEANGTSGSLKRRLLWCPKSFYLMSLFENLMTYFCYIVTLGPASSGQALKPCPSWIPPTEVPGPRCGPPQEMYAVPVKLLGCARNRLLSSSFLYTGNVATPKKNMSWLVVVPSWNRDL